MTVHFWNSPAPAPPASATTATAPHTDPQAARPGRTGHRTDHDDRRTVSPPQSPGAGHAAVAMRADRITFARTVAAGGGVRFHSTPPGDGHPALHSRPVRASR